MAIRRRGDQSSAPCGHSSVGDLSVSKFEPSRKSPKLSKVRWFPARLIGVKMSLQLYNVRVKLNGSTLNGFRGENVSVFVIY